MLAYPKLPSADRIRGSFHLLRSCSTEHAHGGTRVRNCNIVGARVLF